MVLVADKWGRQVVLVAIVPIFAAFTGVAGLATSLGVRVGARFLTGRPRRAGADRPGAGDRVRRRASAPRCCG